MQKLEESKSIPIVLKAEADIDLRGEPSAESDVICTVPSGSAVVLLEYDPPWQRVGTEKGDSGWLPVDDLPAVSELLDEVTWLEGGELLDPARLDALLNALPAKHRPAVRDVARQIDELQVLFDAARAAISGPLADSSRFAELLEHQVGCAAIPQLPSDGLSALSGRTPIGAETIGGGFLPAPGGGATCFLPPPAFEIFGEALVNYARRFGAPGERAFDEAVWAGLWTIDGLTQRVRPLELIHSSLERWGDGKTGVSIALDRMVAFAFDSCADSGSPSSAGFGRQSISGGFEALGPGLGFPPMDACRFERWWRGTRPLRCLCDEFYEIRGIALCDEEEPLGGDVVCPENCVEIRGAGFSRRFLSAFPPTPGSRPPMLRNKVFFQADSGLVEADQFLALPATETELAEATGWSDTRIRVVVPPQAVSGEVTLRIFCTRPAAAWPSEDYLEFDCGGRYRRRQLPDRLDLRLHHPWAVTVGPRVTASIEVDSTDGASGSAMTGESVTVRTQACSVATITFRAEHLDPDTWTLVDGDGATVEPDERSDEGDRRVWIVTDDAQQSRTFRLVVQDLCGSTETRELRLERYHRVTIVPDDIRLTAREMVLARAHVSCPLPETETVRIQAPAISWNTGVLLPTSSSSSSFPMDQVVDVPIAAGELRSAPFPVGADPFDTGSALLSARIVTDHSPPHEAGHAIVHVAGKPVGTVVEGQISLSVDPPFEIENPLNSGRFPTTATFNAARTEVLFAFVEHGLPVLHWVKRLNPDVPATYEPRGHMTLPLDLLLGGPLIGESRITVTVDTRNRRTLSSGSGFRFQRSPGALSGFGLLVDTGVAVGGTLDGRTVDISLTLEVTPLPLQPVTRV